MKVKLFESFACIQPFYINILSSFNLIYIELINQAGAFLVPGKSSAVAEETELENIHSSDDYADTSSLLEQVTTCVALELSLH